VRPQEENDMATHVRFDPLHDLFGFPETLARAFDATYGRNRAAKDSAVPAYAPEVTVHEDQEGLWLYAEVPGVSQEDIDLKVEGNTLTLKAERKLERSRASFHRSFTLPETVDAEAVSAESKDGVLKIRLPKRAESKPRQIKVAVEAPRLDRAPADKQ
jgi:HSP20 family protein